MLLGLLAEQVYPLTEFETNTPLVAPSQGNQPLPSLTQTTSPPLNLRFHTAALHQKTIGPFRHSLDLSHASLPSISPTSSQVRGNREISERAPLIGHGHESVRAGATGGCDPGSALPEAALRCQPSGPWVPTSTIWLQGEER